MQYRVIFDNTSVGYTTWHFAITGMAGVIIGAVLVAIVVRRGTLPFRAWSSRPRASKVFAFFILLFTTVWTSIALHSTYCEYSILRDARKNGSAKIVEGPVTDFKPMPVSGHAMERFCISGRCFEYSDYRVTSGFNNTTSHGGPIREGLPVRVTYFGNAILKLEVAPAP